LLDYYYYLLLLLLSLTQNDVAKGIFNSQKDYQKKFYAFRQRSTACASTTANSLVNVPQEHGDHCTLHNAVFTSRMHAFNKK
jgi:hypothetical protein